MAVSLGDALEHAPLPYASRRQSSKTPRRTRTNNPAKANYPFLSDGYYPKRCYILGFGCIAPRCAL
jgi:hypothetical protein